MEKNYTGINGLEYLISLLATLPNRFVVRESGKGLSTNDFTDVAANFLESLSAEYPILYPTIEYATLTQSDVSLYTMDSLDEEEDYNLISSLYNEGYIYRGRIPVMVENPSHLPDGIEILCDVIFDATGAESGIFSGTATLSFVSLHGTYYLCVYSTEIPQFSTDIKVVIQYCRRK